MDKAEWLAYVLNQYESRLIRYAAGILGDIDAARDAVQDTFLRLCRENPGTVKDYLAQWLFTVCRNRAIDLKRKARRVAVLEGEDREELPSPQLHPLVTMEDQESMERILRVLDTLPESQREVVRLKFQNDLSYKEISQITQHSVTNVGFLIHTALKTIREKLKSESGSVRRGLRRIK